MKKYLFKILLSMLGFLCVWSLAMSFWSTTWAQDTTDAFPYDVVLNSWGNETTDIGQVVNTDSVNPATAQNSILSRLTNFFRISGTSYNPDNTWSPAISYIKWVINIVLALVSLAALILIIYAFYLIFFWKAEEGFTKAKKILVGVAIALAIMWLSRFITSFLFNIFTTVK